jgi:clan AA aspartic protease
MAREDGSVNGQLEAWLRVQATNGEIIECLIDTGFNGALVLPRADAVRLNLTVLGRAPIIGVGRARLVADIAELEIEWLDQTRAVEVIISDGDDSLLGTELLDGNRLVVDYIAYTVTVSDEVS